MAGGSTRDVEGVTLYEADDEEGYVIVSSQGIERVPRV